MANQITQNLLNNAIKSLVSYGTIKSTDSPSAIIEELTATGFFDDVKLSKEEAMAFAGIIKKPDKKGDMQYVFDVDEASKTRTTGHTVLTSSQELGIGYTNGFDAVILKDNATGEASISVAGTHLNPLDFGADADLAVLGFTAQDKSMETFYQAAISSETGGAQKDVLLGGQGNDTLQGGIGSDVYIYERGHGHDTIDDQGQIIIHYFSQTGYAYQDSLGQASKGKKYEGDLLRQVA